MLTSPVLNIENVNGPVPATNLLLKYKVKTGSDVIK